MSQVVSVGYGIRSVGISTLVMITSCILALKNKVLVIDLNPNFNISFFFQGIDKTRAKYISKALLNNDCDEYVKDDILKFGILPAMVEQNPEKFIVEISNNLHFIPTNEYLELASMMVYVPHSGLKLNFQSLRNLIDKIRDKYDFIIIDTPSRRTSISDLAITASDHLIVPVWPERFITDKIDSAIEFAQRANSNIKTSIMLSEIDDSDLNSTFENLLKNQYKDMMLETVLPWDPEIARAFKDYSYFKKCIADKKISLKYFEFADELRNFLTNY